MAIIKIRKVGAIKVIVITVEWQVAAELEKQIHSGTDPEKSLRGGYAKETQVGWGGSHG